MKEIEATVITIDSTDVLSALVRIETLRRQLADKEQAASKARHDLDACEQRARTRLQRYPALLAEFEAELREQTRRQEERHAREARIALLRKQTQH